MLLISVFSLTIGAPFTSPDESESESEYPDTDDRVDGSDAAMVTGREDSVNFKIVKLDDGLSLAWDILGESLLLSIKLSKINKWAVVGFTDINKPVHKLDQALFFRIRKTRPITVKV